MRRPPRLQTALQTPRRAPRSDPRGRLAALLLLALTAGWLTLAGPARAAEPAPGGAKESAAQAAKRSTQELGALLCASYASYCSTLWQDGMKRGAPFNQLIAETCLWVRFRENEDAGIACAETAIRNVPELPDAVLVQGQFAPGERRRHVFWRHQTDRQWAQVAADYIQHIPAYCDQVTPVIYDYFPCLLHEVQYFQTVLKKYSRFWRAPLRS